MYQIIILCIVKIVDNFILTAKTIFVQKGKSLLTMLSVMISQFLFYFVISAIVEDGNILTIILISIASGLGSFLALGINHKFSKDRLYINMITSRATVWLEELCEYLKNNNIKYITTDAYNRDWSKSYCVQIFAYTKNQSKTIDKYFECCSKKYLRQIIT